MISCLLKYKAVYLAAKSVFGIQLNSCIAVLNFQVLITEVMLVTEIVTA